MKNLPKSIIGLLIALSVFFNLERVDLGDENFINIASLIYVLVAVSCLATLRFRFLFTLNSTSLVLFWQSIYLLTAWLLLNRKGFADDRIYLYVTEMTFLSIVVLLTQKLAHHLKDFEEAVENITFSGLTRQKKLLEESIADIQNQMLLSRRYDRPLGLIVLETEPSALSFLSNRAVQEIQRTLMRRYVSTSVVRVLDSQLRRTDLVVQAGNGSFVIVCPETDRPHMQILVERVQSALTEQLGVRINCGTASFPDIALTFDELLLRAESQMKDDRTKAVSPSTPAEPEIVLESSS